MLPPTFVVRASFCANCWPAKYLAARVRSGSESVFEIRAEYRGFPEFLRRRGHCLGTLGESLKRCRCVDKIFLYAFFFTHCSVKMLQLPEDHLQLSAF